MLCENFLCLAALGSMVSFIYGQNENANISSNSNNLVESKAMEQPTQIKQIQFEFKEMQKKISALEDTVYSLNATINQLMELILKNILNQKKKLDEEIKAQQQEEESVKSLFSKHIEKLTNLKYPVFVRKLNPTEYDKNFNCVKYCNAQGISVNCAELMSDETNLDHVYLLAVPDDTELKPFGAYCKRHNNTGWTIIQRRMDGSVDFYRDWNNYKNGFGNLNGEYWLGLERIHKMTKQQKYELWIQLESYENGTRFARYSNFSVASENEGYKLTVSGYSGNALDAFSYDNGKMFTTFDMDNDDNYEENCAQLKKGGWWYFVWNYHNLNGEYKSYDRRMEDNMNLGEYGIFWSEWLDLESLKYVHMAIRPVVV